MKATQFAYKCVYFSDPLLEKAHSIMISRTINHNTNVAKVIDISFVLCTTLADVTESFKYLHLCPPRKLVCSASRNTHIYICVCVYMHGPMPNNNSSSSSIAVGGNSSHWCGGDRHGTFVFVRVAPVVTTLRSASVDTATAHARVPPSSSYCEQSPCPNVNYYTAAIDAHRSREMRLLATFYK